MDTQDVQEYTQVNKNDISNLNFQPLPQIKFQNQQYNSTQSPSALFATSTSISKTYYRDKLDSLGSQRALNREINRPRHDNEKSYSKVMFKNQSNQPQRFYVHNQNQTMVSQRSR